MTRSSDHRRRSRLARWRRRGKIAAIVVLVDAFVTLAQTPVVFQMAENAGHELCAMARRGELQNWKWPKQPRGIVNSSPGVLYWLRRSAPLLAESCSVRVYPALWPSDIVMLHVRPDAARNRALREWQLTRHWNLGRTEGLWIAAHYNLLWTPLFDLLRSPPYGGRLEIDGFGN